MSGLLGKDHLIQIDISGTPTTITCQGDLTYSPGKSVETSVTKNCRHPYVVNGGATASFTMELEVPAAAVQTAVLTAADNETIVECTITSTVVGAPTFSGDARWAYEMSSPVDGIATATVTVAFEGTPTRGAVSA